MMKLRGSENDTTPHIDSILPAAAIPGGEIELRGTNLGPTETEIPRVWVGKEQALVLLSRRDRILLQTPPASRGAQAEVQREGLASNAVPLRVAQPLAEEIHAVANPAIDADGNVFTTFSGSRGQETAVSVFRISPEGDKESFLTGIVNATGLAFDRTGYLYVSSRQEGAIYRVSPEGAASVYAEGMGIATGLAFDAAGNLYCGDRSGTIFKIGPDRQIFVFATLEPSVAAYHLAFGPDGILYVTAPSTSSNDCIWAVHPDGNTEVYLRGLGRPQGLAVDVAGDIYVAASWRGQRGIFRISAEHKVELTLAGSGIVGLAFAPDGGMVVATGLALYHVDMELEGFRFA